MVLIVLSKRHGKSQGKNTLEPLYTKCCLLFNACFARPFNIFDKDDLRFCELRNTVCVELRKEGIGADVSPVITSEHENIMWESGLLGFESYGC